MGVMSTYTVRPETLRLIAVAGGVGFLASI